MLEITADAGQGLAIDFEGDGNDVQAAARVRMQLSEGDHVTVDTIAAHLNGVPRGAKATATITFHANQR
jgi:hypothetical protein